MTRYPKYCAPSPLEGGGYEDGIEAHRNRFICRLLAALPNRIRMEDSAKPLLQFLSPQACMEIYRSLQQHLGEEDDAGKQEEPGDIGYVLAGALVNNRHRPFVEAAILRHLASPDTPKQAEGAARAESLDERLKRIAEMFSLGTLESQVLLLAFIYEVDRPFNYLLGLNDLELNTSKSILRKRILSCLLDCTQSQVTLALRPEGKLIGLGILDSDFEPSEDIRLYLLGDTDRPLENSYYRIVENALPLDCFGHLQNQVDLIGKLVRRAQERCAPLHILLYGAPGTGKTSFVRSLGHALGIEVVEILNSMRKDEKGEAYFRLRALRACANRVSPTGSLILMDECDAMLNGTFEPVLGLTHVNKGDINDFLDQSRHIIFWVTNAHHGILDSIRRRFDHSLEFRIHSPHQRAGIWRHILRTKGAEVISENETAALAEAYPISAAGIELALRNSIQVTPKGSPAICMSSLHALLHSHSELMELLPRETASASGNERRLYDPELSETAGGLTDLMRALRRWDALNRTPTQAGVQGLSLLLHGPPGTGKSELAGHIARELDRPLLVRRASDLFDKYVGGSEKNIRAAFREAASDGAVLLFDEADSLLADRQGAQHSWEVSQVNELLSAMEFFQGIFICATNFLDRLDAASLRRFTFKLEFRWMSGEKLLKLYDRLLAPLCSTPMDGDARKHLLHLDKVAPGDLHLLRKRISLTGGRPTSQEIVQELEQELRLKGLAPSRGIGFLGGTRKPANGHAVQPSPIRIYTY